MVQEAGILRALTVRLDVVPYIDGLSALGSRICYPSACHVVVQVARATPCGCGRCGVPELGSSSFAAMASKLGDAMMANYATMG